MIPTGFQIELDELYRFQSKKIYLSPHLHPLSRPKPPKTPKNHWKTQTVPHQWRFRVNYHWFQINLDTLYWFHSFFCEQVTLVVATRLTLDWNRSNYYLSLLDGSRFEICRWIHICIKINCIILSVTTFFIIFMIINKSNHYIFNSYTVHSPFSRSRWRRCITTFVTITFIVGRRKKSLPGTIDPRIHENWFILVGNFY